MSYNNILPGRMLVERPDLVEKAWGEMAPLVASQAEEPSAKGEWTYYDCGREGELLCTVHRVAVSPDGVVMFYHDTTGEWEPMSATLEPLEPEAWQRHVDDPEYDEEAW